MMDILSSFMVNPSGPPISFDLQTGLSFVGSAHLPFTFLTLTPFASTFLGSTGPNFSFEIFRTGLFHGLFFSLPFSIPMLICFRRYILDGVSLGNYAFAGTLFGHLSFVFCTIQGIRPIIHFWYPLEPLLSLLGLALSLKVATDFFSQRRFVFDGTLGSAEDSSAYALNPWPKMPEISWFLPPELTSKTAPMVSALLRFPKTAFAALQQSKVLAPLWVLFQKFQNFCEKNLGPSIFTFQFFLMWLNPASASTLNLLFFEHDILQGIFGSRNSPIFLLYTVGFISAAGALCTFILFLIYQLAGRSLSFKHFFGPTALGTSGKAPHFVGSAANEIGSPAVSKVGWLQRGTRFIQFDEALAQNRFKIFNKFFAFLIIGCVVQGGLNYTWRLFLQYPLEMIHWNFFTSLTKNLGIFDRSGVQLREMNAPKEPFQKQNFSSGPGSLGRPTALDSVEPFSQAQIQPDLMSRNTDPFHGFQATSANGSAKLAVGSSVNKFGFSLPSYGTDEIKTASSSLIPKDAHTTKKGVGGSENYWGTLEKNEDFTVPNSLFVENPLNTIPVGSDTEPTSLAAFSPSIGGTGEIGSEQVINFFGRREFPPYDTSIRNREKNLPVERHLAIERVNSRRGLMGRPPLENEERENAIFKYHTFFMNQIDRAVEDLKMKFVTPSDLYREEDDILALQKLHENYLKQKGRESEYQNSVKHPKQPSPEPISWANGVPKWGSLDPQGRTSGTLGAGSLPRHHRDFFTKSRPVTNTTKGFSKSSYIRDLFDQNLQQAYSAYSHDDLLLEKIIPSINP